METRQFTVDKDDIIKAGKMISEGKLVAFPTETVYGLGANGLDGKAVGRIYEAKGRPSDNPLILHIANLEEIYPLTSGLSPMALALAKKFWPGPMTLVVPKSDIIPKEVYKKLLKYLSFLSFFILC